MEYAFDETLSLEPESRENRGLLPALIAVALVGHVVILYWLPYDKRTSSVDPRVAITLLPLLARQAAPVEQSPPQAQSKHEPTTLSTRPMTKTDTLHETTTEKLAAPDSPNLSNQVREQLRQLTSKQPEVLKPQQRYFGQSYIEHQRGAAEPDFYRKSYFSAPKTSIQQPSSTGAALTLVGDYCYQQRGDLNDASTWRWVRVRAELCGHK